MAVIRRRKWVTIAVFTFLVVALFATQTSFSSAQVQDAQSPVESFRTDLMELSVALTDCDALGLTGDPDLVASIAEAGDDQIAAMYAAWHDPASLPEYTAVVDDFCSAPPPAAAGSSTDLGAIAQAVVDTGFPPSYPSGGDYNTVIGELQGVGLLDHGPQNRTDPNGLAEAWIAALVLEDLAIVAQATCDAAPSGDIVVANTVACPLAGVAWIAYTADKLFIEYAYFQDGLIDGAEIEAAYENSVTGLANQGEMSDQLDRIEGKLVALQGDIDTIAERQLEIIRLLHTPEGRRTSDVPACDGEPCDYPDK